MQQSNMSVTTVKCTLFPTRRLRTLVQTMSEQSFESQAGMDKALPSFRNDVFVTSSDSTHLSNSQVQKVKDIFAPPNPPWIFPNSNGYLCLCCLLLPDSEFCFDLLGKMWLEKLFSFRFSFVLWVVQDFTAEQPSLDRCLRRPPSLIRSHCQGKRFFETQKCKKCTCKKSPC